MFHYTVPYTDIYMETVEPFRRRGFGSCLVQEFKRCAYELGSIPCARCNPANVVSRKTLQKAGLVPFAHILNGSIRGMRFVHDPQRGSRSARLQPALPGLADLRLSVLRLGV